MTAHILPPSVSAYRAAAAVVESWQRPLLLTHERPDGDALGCILGLRAILRERGILARAVVYEPIPLRYACLPDVDALYLLGSARPEPDRTQAGREAGSSPAASGQPPAAITREELESADGIVVMDTCAFGQLAPIADFLRATSAPIIALDHHRTRDLPAARYLVDPDAAAAALMVCDWARAAHWELPNEARALLFVGIATDTGWFRHSNTSPAALRAAADLVERGVDLDHWHRALYLSDPPQVLRARAAALASLELCQDERVAVMMVSQQALQSAGAVPTDLEEAVNMPMSAASVEVSILLTETRDGGTKASFRSKGQIDVAQLAARFGGGGHARAAGARLAVPLQAAREAILGALG